MLPLVLFPGAGSELYRGLGSVVIGGLALSAVLTLLIVPPLLAVVATRQQRKRERLEHGPGRSLARRHRRGVKAPTTGAPLHAWDLSPAKTPSRCRRRSPAPWSAADRFGPGGRRAIKRVAGVDAAFADGGRVIRAAAVVLDYPGLGVTDQVLVERPDGVSLRAGACSPSAKCRPCWRRSANSTAVPDLILCDGHGYRPPASLRARLPFGALAGCAHNWGREVEAHRRSRRARSRPRAMSRGYSPTRVRGPASELVPSCEPVSG